LLPLFRARHRALLESASRSNSHTYTSFYRSPRQLEALTGPVVDHLLAGGPRQISILIFAGSNGAEAYTMASELLAARPELSFSIRASDLHAETVAKATAGRFTLEEITQGLDIPPQFIARTFDRNGDIYTVKASVRAQVSFERADLLSDGLATQFAPADLVVAQNVLFHMPPEMARRAFANIIRFLKPGGVLFIEGMELDMRVELTAKANLAPLDFHTREIYDYSRRHIPVNWWDYYYGNEPYFPLARTRLRRYGTIFFAPAAPAC
jgi:chemotaxis methyl-accepting protein methylase